MKRTFIFVLLVLFIGLFYAEPFFTGNSSFEFVVNDNGLFEYDGVFTISKGPVSLAVEEYITTDDGIVSADYPEFVFTYGISDFTFEGTASNYLGIDFSYSKNVFDVFTFNPSAYYDHVIIPDIADNGIYGFAVVVSKGIKFLPPVGFSVELDGDYADDWFYVLCVDASYKIGSDNYFMPYVATDLDITNDENEFDAGVEFCFIEGVVFDANWVFEENTYSLSTTISY